MSETAVNYPVAIDVDVGDGAAVPPAVVVEGRNQLKSSDSSTASDSIPPPDSTAAEQASTSNSTVEELSGGKITADVGNKPRGRRGLRQLFVRHVLPVAVAVGTSLVVGKILPLPAPAVPAVSTATAAASATALAAVTITQQRRQQRRSRAATSVKTGDTRWPAWKGKTGSGTAAGQGLKELATGNKSTPVAPEACHSRSSESTEYVAIQEGASLTAVSPDSCNGSASSCTPASPREVQTESSASTSPSPNHKHSKVLSCVRHLESRLNGAPSYLPVSIKQHAANLQELVIPTVLTPQNIRSIANCPSLSSLTVHAIDLTQSSTQLKMGDAGDATETDNSSNIQFTHLRQLTANYVQLSTGSLGSVAPNLETLSLDRVNPACLNSLAVLDGTTKLQHAEVMLTDKEPPYAKITWTAARPSDLQHSRSQPVPDSPTAHTSATQVTNANVAGQLEHLESVHVSNISSPQQLQHLLSHLSNAPYLSDLQLTMRRSLPLGPSPGSPTSHTPSPGSPSLNRAHSLPVHRFVPVNCAREHILLKPLEQTSPEPYTPPVPITSPACKLTRYNSVSRPFTQAQLQVLATRVRSSKSATHQDLSASADNLNSRTGSVDGKCVLLSSDGGDDILVANVETHQETLHSGNTVTLDRGWEEDVASVSPSRTGIQEAVSVPGSTQVSDSLPKFGHATSPLHDSWSADVTNLGSSPFMQSGRQVDQPASAAACSLLTGTNADFLSSGDSCATGGTNSTSSSDGHQSNIPLQPSPHSSAASCIVMQSVTSLTVKGELQGSDVLGCLLAEHSSPTWPSLRRLSTETK